MVSGFMSFFAVALAAIAATIFGVPAVSMVSENISKSLPLVLVFSELLILGGLGVVSTVLAVIKPVERFVKMQWIVIGAVFPFALIGATSGTGSESGTVLAIACFMMVFAGYLTMIKADLEQPPITAALVAFLGNFTVISVLYYLAS